MKPGRHIAALGVQEPTRDNDIFYSNGRNTRSNTSEPLKYREDRAEGTGHPGGGRYVRTGPRFVKARCCDSRALPGYDIYATRHP